MTMARPGARAAGIGAALVAFAGWAAAASTDSGKATSGGPAADCSPHVSWSELQFRASKFFMSASATMKVEQVPIARAKPDLKTAPEGTPLQLPSSCLTRITVTTTMPLGGGEEVTVWVDPDSAAAQQYEKLKKGHSAYHKIGRYTEHGYYLWRSSPATPYQETHSPADWSHHKTHFSSWGDELPSGAVVTDPYALLYLVSKASLGHADQRLRTYVFADGHLIELSFETTASTTVGVDFKETWNGGSHHRSGRMRVRVVRVSAKEAGTEGNSGKVDLGFLGMRGTMRILLEPGSDVPVAIKGDVEHLGELTAEVQEVRLREPPGG